VSKTPLPRIPDSVARGNLSRVEYAIYRLLIEEDGVERRKKEGSVAFQLKR